MTALTFDALDYFEKLKNAGVSEEQAKIQANAFRDFAKAQQEQNARELATKADLQHGLDQLRLAVSDSRHEIIKWLITAIIAQTALMAGLIGVVIAYLPK